MYLVFSLAGRRIRKLIFSFNHCVTFKETVSAGNYYLRIKCTKSSFDENTFFFVGIKKKYVHSTVEI